MTYERKLARYLAQKKREAERPTVTVARLELERVIQALIEETPDSLKQAEQFISKYLKTNGLSNVPVNTSPGGS